MVREMIKEDWMRVGAIYQQGINTNKATFQTCIPDYDNWNESHLKECRYVITSDNNVIGWAALSPTSSRCVYEGVCEVSIYIDNAFKGQGVGTQLLRHMIVESEKRGIWTVQAGIMKDNESSLKLHKKCGFREIGYREKVAKDSNGNWRTVILMERRSHLLQFN